MTGRLQALLEGIYDNNKAADVRNTGGLRRFGIAWNRLAAQPLLCSVSIRDGPRAQKDTQNQGISRLPDQPDQPHQPHLTTCVA